MRVRQFNYGSTISEPLSAILTDVKMAAARSSVSVSIPEGNRWEFL
ncbi:MAG: hypothetical protein KAW09_09655 [Thermoplasmata archaeon]|nr:hypothetical protein [Thermoplasmata archaeon]